MTVLIQVLSPAIAAMAAIIAALISYHSSRSNTRTSASQTEIEFRRRQLNELYGPIYMKQSTSVGLRKMLPGLQEDGKKWRLVDHIEEIKASDDPVLIACVEQLISINEDIMRDIVEKSELYVAFPPPIAFSRYVAHVEFLTFTWRQGRNQPAGLRLPFPNEFDSVIEQAVRFIRDRLIELGGLPDPEVDFTSVNEHPPWHASTSID